MKSITVKNKWMMDRNLLTVISEYGWGNGYVLIDENHPFYNISYENIPVNVHGGLTFGEIITPDILHIFNKNIDKDHPYLNESDIGKYMVGFDTRHYNDNLQNWNKKNVIAETLRLKKQLCDLSNDEVNN